MIIPYTPDPMSNALLQYWANLLTSLSALYGEQSEETPIPDDVPIIYGKGYQMFTYINTVQKYFFYQADIQIDEQSLSGYKPIYDNFVVWEIPHEHLTVNADAVTFAGSDVSVGAIQDRLARSDFTPPVGSWTGGLSFNKKPMKVRLPVESEMSIPLNVFSLNIPITNDWTEEYFNQWYWQQGGDDFSPRITGAVTALRINQESHFGGMKRAGDFLYKYEPIDNSIYIKPSSSFTYDDIQNLFNVYIIPDIEDNYPDLSEEPLEFPLFDFQGGPDDNPIIRPLNPIKIPQAPEELDTAVLIDGFTFLGDVTTWYYNLLSDFGLSAVLAVVLVTTIVLREVGGK